MPDNLPSPDNYLGGYYFKVAIDGVEAGEFLEAEGLTTELEVVEYHEGGQNDGMIKVIGPTRWQNIVLRRGHTDSQDLWNWMKKTVDAQTIERKNGSIMLCNRKGEVKMQWDFSGGWPCRWEGPALDALENEVAVELLEIAHEGFEVKKAAG